MIWLSARCIRNDRRRPVCRVQRVTKALCTTELTNSQSGCIKYECKSLVDSFRSLMIFAANRVYLVDSWSQATLNYNHHHHHRHHPIVFHFACAALLFFSPIRLTASNFHSCCVFFQLLMAKSFCFAVSVQTNSWWSLDACSRAIWACFSFRFWSGNKGAQRL